LSRPLTYFPERETAETKISGPSLAHEAEICLPKFAVIKVPVCRNPGW
jgi:hypothetical protein